MRHFHQSPDYWLDNCTLQDWRGTWQRELIEAPPAESFLAGYFKYDPPVLASDRAEEEDDGEVDLGLPEFEG